MRHFNHRQSRYRAALLLGVALLATGCTQQPAPQTGPSWSNFYDRVAGRPPRPVLLDALERFEEEGRPVQQAVDAGCGQGIDTLHMLARGIAVHAFDSEAEGIRRLEANVAPQHRDLLRSEVAPFHEASWQPGMDLVFAGFALPFASPKDFPAAWAEITKSLAVGGRFAGQLFGDRDDWANIPGRTHHTREEVEALFAGVFEIEVFEEIEDDRPSPRGTKHWHFYEIIARKVAPP